jgi:hypothetical protein
VQQMKGFEHIDVRFTDQPDRNPHSGPSDPA